MQVERKEFCDRPQTDEVLAWMKELTESDNSLFQRFIELYFAPGTLDDQLASAIFFKLDYIREYIRVLVARHNGLFSPSLQSLSLVLRDLVHLHTLDLSYNSLGVEGARHLAQAFSPSSTGYCAIRHLLLVNCSLTDEGMCRFSLHSLFSIRSIILSL